MKRKNKVCFSILNILSYRSENTALLPVLSRSKFCYFHLSKAHEDNFSVLIFYIFLVCLAHTLQAVIRFLRSGHLMCTYKSLAPKLEIIFIFDYQAHGLLLQMLSKTFGHISKYCAYNAKYRATNRKDSLTVIQDNTINAMVYTISHRFNTHVKQLSLSASVVFIIITCLLATSRIITQYFNHLLLYNFTTSQLNIDEPSLTIQLCHSWLGTFGN